MECGNGYSRTPSAEGFARLTVSGFRQFGLVDIDLSNRLTILTGANGAGKTTLLNILGAHFSWHTTLLATPRDRIRGSGNYSLGIRKLDRSYLQAALGIEDEQRLNALEEMMNRRVDSQDGYGRPPQRAVGELVYSNGSRSPLLIPENAYSIQYNVSIDQQLLVEGLYLSSHRSLSSYQQVSWIPSEFARSEQILQEYVNELWSALAGHRSEKSSMLRMKESLLAAAIYGEGNSSVVSDREARAVWDGFQEVLSLLLPESLGFERLKAEPPEIVLETKTGPFAIDSISGGMSALFELAWQIHLRASGNRRFTVCFDEPENHLHPSLQRSLIPSLMRAFPQVNFIIATHSPFIVTAARDARVYVLKYNDEQLVDSSELDFQNKAQSAERTLTDVLGLTSTSPIWAEEEFDAIMARFAGQEITPASIRALKSELEQSGLADELPIALDRYLRQAEVD